MLRIPGLRDTKTTRYAAAGVTTAGAAAIALTGLAGTANAGDHSQSTAKSTSASSAAYPHAQQGQHPQAADAKAKQGTLDANVARADKKVAAQKQNSVQVSPADSQKAAKEHTADTEDTKDAKASRSSDRPETKDYPNNVDGWIKEARTVMDKHNIPGSYQGIKKNVMRESGGNPTASNNWDINAQKGTPSKGLLQMIQPTFDQYHVKGTKDKMTDPVANIVAACNYAADKYGSMDNVNGAY